MAEAKRDNNYVPTMIAVSNADGVTPVVLWADPTTHRLLVSLANTASITGTITSLSGTATTAGGATSPALAMGTAALGVYFGSGAPTITAPQGSLYLRTDGSSTSTRMYVNTNGATTWTNVTTAA